MARKHLLIPLALVAALAACDNQALQPPTEQPGLVDPMFARYVAFGNSVTAGFESAGINDSTQKLSYANLLATQMKTEFNIPLLNKPGCPPPYANVFTQELVGDPGPLGCALRNPTIPPYLNLVAIPGAAVLDVYDPLGTGNSSNTLTTVLGGGRSQVDNAALVEPTFVTVWIGNNDVLGAVLSSANPGDPALVTSPATFAERFGKMMDSLDAFGTIQGGALVGVVQIGLVPYLTQGRVWKGFEAQFDAMTAPLNAFDVSMACLANTPLPTGDTAWTAVPFPIGGAALSLAKARVDSVQGGLLAPGNLVPAVIDCADANAVTNTEMANIFSAVAQYNAAIEAEADARGWAYLDPNPRFVEEIVAGTILTFPAFPGLPGVDSTTSRTAPFGTTFSLDGIHPSASGQILIVNELISVINAKYGTNIPAVQ